VLSKASSLKGFGALFIGGFKVFARVAEIPSWAHLGLTSAGIDGISDIPVRWVLFGHDGSITQRRHFRKGGGERESQAWRRNETRGKKEKGETGTLYTTSMRDKKN
jgi:hypothetical protein